MKTLLLSRKSSNNSGGSAVIVENEQAEVNVVEMSVESQQVKPLPLESVDSVDTGLNDVDIQVVEETEIVGDNKQ